MKKAGPCHSIPRTRGFLRQIHSNATATILLYADLFLLTASSSISFLVIPIKYECMQTIMISCTRNLSLWTSGHVTEWRWVGISGICASKEREMTLCTYEQQICGDNCCTKVRTPEGHCTKQPKPIRLYLCRIWNFGVYHIRRCQQHSTVPASRELPERLKK